MTLEFFPLNRICQTFISIICSKCASSHHKKMKCSTYSLSIFFRISTSFSIKASSNICRRKLFLRSGIPHSTHAPDPRTNSSSTQFSHLQRHRWVKSRCYLIETDFYLTNNIYSWQPVGIFFQMLLWWDMAQWLRCWTWNWHCCAPLSHWVRHFTYINSPHPEVMDIWLDNERIVIA